MISRTLSFGVKSVKITSMTTKRILLVDDETQITRVLKRSLAAHRYDVRAAADGESALDLFRDWSPDLVITDL